MLPTATRKLAKCELPSSQLPGSQLLNLVDGVCHLSLQFFFAAVVVYEDICVLFACLVVNLRVDAPPDVIAVETALGSQPFDAQVFVGMLTIGVLGALTSGLIEVIGRRVTRWLPRGQEQR